VAVADDGEGDGVRCVLKNGSARPDDDAAEVKDDAVERASGDEFDGCGVGDDDVNAADEGIGAFYQQLLSSVQS
jgi:hypothetical protein